MFDRRLKDFLPTSLLGRAALIYLVPVLTILGVMSVVFIQRLYEDVTRQMTAGVAEEIALLTALIESEDGPAEALVLGRDIAGPLGIGVSYSETPVDTARAAIDLSGRTVIATLEDRFEDLAGVDLTAPSGRVRISLPSRHGFLRFEVPRGRFSARNPHQFLVLIGATALFMTLIALLYMRGQVRPIRRLAIAATAFGKGRVMAYRPSGAREVREAGNAFLDMRARIERQIEQRTTMLSGVSHDLRTPLTRIRLALSLLDDREAAEAIGRDVAEMQRMLDAFLDFARGDAHEEAEFVSPAQIVRDAIDRASRAQWQVEAGDVADVAPLRLHPAALGRALDNLIGNAVRYGRRARVGLVEDASEIRFIVEDEGPGIPEELRLEAKKPFSRLDKARNQDDGVGVGLGLAIAEDIAGQHGGRLDLEKSEELGGLRAVIAIPR